MINVSMSKLGFVAIGLPLFGFLFAVFWSILYDFEASNRTSCHVSLFCFVNLNSDATIIRIFYLFILHHPLSGFTCRLPG